MYRDFAEKGRIPKFLRKPVSKEQKALKELFLNGRVASFAEVVDLEIKYLAEGRADLEPGIVRRGFYAEQIERYYNCFGRSSVQVHFLEEMIDDPERALAEIYTFLGLGAPVPGSTLSKGNARAYPEALSGEVAQTLCEVYRPKNAELRALLGRDLPWPAE